MARARGTPPSPRLKLLPLTPRERLVVVLAVFVLTRLALGYVADNPRVYGDGRADASTDVGTYDYWAYRMHDKGDIPYRDFTIEYPPGVIPPVYWERVVDPFAYRTEFIALMIVVDGIGLLAVYRMARRTGAWWGVVAWLMLLPLLGPVAYTRLDLIVAVALVWAVERAHAGHWATSGTLIGVGIVVKLTPALLLPAMFFVAVRRRRFVVSAVAVAAASLVPFVTMLPDVYDDAIEFHVNRGVHAESLWGSLMLASHTLTGSHYTIVFEYGGWDVVSDWASAVKAISNLLSIVILLASAVFAWRRVRRGDVAHLSIVLFALLALLMVSGRVLSPQYFAWIIALAAAALTLAPRELKVPAVLLTVAVAASHLFYPVLFYDMFTQSDVVVALLVIRNVSLGVAGIVAARAAIRLARSHRDPVLDHAVAG